MKYRLPYNTLAMPFFDMSSPRPPTVEDEEIDTMAPPTDRSRASSTAETNPSTHYFAKALPAREGGYTAQYGIPGLLPTRLKDETGAIAVFTDAETAEFEAARAMIAVLNSRSQSLRGRDKPERYRKLTPAELADLLAKANLTPTFFAYLYGTDPGRVLKWLEGNEDIPHPARIMLEVLIAHPDATTVAELATDAITTQIKPRRTE